MKKNIYLIIILQIISFHVFPQQGEWTWMNGDNTTNSAGVFGIQGTPDPNNMPPAFYEACQWTDLQGNFWLYGGQGSGMYSDLWKYDPTTNEWTWVNGPGIPNQLPVYGTQGVPSINNNPGIRSWSVITWTDAIGNLWLFGGFSGSSYFNDLWKYDISTNEWTWMKGDNIGNQPGIYGTMGGSSPTNCPGARAETSCSWTVNNDLWFFGGVGSAATTFGGLNDLWKYDISTNEWTWVKGDSVADQAGIYGTQGVSNPANKPGARISYSKWCDNNNNLWLFGGAKGSFSDPYNDLWKYDIITNNWTWISGSNVPNNNNGNYGTKCTPSVNNLPPVRYENRACWKDVCGNFWFFGGQKSGGTYNDLWHYNILTNEWTWISGSDLLNQSGVYGTKGVSSPANMPGSRAGSVSWMDLNGNLWLFGGIIVSWGNFGNDLWKYVPDPDCPAINAVQLTVSNDTSICKGTSLTLTASGASDYEWSQGDTNASITISPQNTTTYTVTGSNGLCLSDTDEIIVIVYSLPTVNAGNDTLICVGSAATLTASGASNYAWNTGSTDSSIIVLSQNTATYTVTGTNGICSDADTVIVTVNPVPSVNLGIDTCMVSGALMNLGVSSGFDNYLWQDGSTNNIYTVSDSGIYYIQITDTCGIAADTINIDICISSEIYVPNSFTPNEDGNNDVFVPIATNITDFEMYIFNRWGQEIFHTTDINEGWDGKCNGKLCSQGVYSWLMYYSGIDNPEKKKKYGHVTLLK